MIAGVQMDMGGTQYTVPPLNLRIFFAHESDIDVLTHPGQNGTVAYTKAAVAVLHECLKRNYPDIGIDVLMDAVDYPQLPSLIAAIFGQSGFVSRPLATSQPSQSAEQPSSVT